MRANTTPPIPPRWFERERYTVEDHGYETPCWIWAQSLSAGGYGQVVFRHPDGRQQGARAHRVFFERDHGPVDRDLHLDHLCRVRACVNPEHLEPVTAAENVRRGMLGVLRTHCVNGHAYSPENTYTGCGRRECRTCHRVQQRAYVARRNSVVTSCP